MKTNKNLLIFSIGFLALGLAACGGSSSSDPVSSNEESQPEVSEIVEGSSVIDSGPVDNSEVGDEDYVPRPKQEMPTAEIVDADYDYGDPATWAGTDYASQSLGYVYLQDIIDDDVYDWGHSVLYEDGVYRMWWTRPAVYDAIFYAESVDMKNWTNVQRVICLSPNATNITKYDNIKGMLGKPSVVHVGDTYYMYFEAPATEDPDITQTVLEWDNQVMLALSKDGIHWEFHSDAKGQPQPVVAMKSEFMRNFNTKNYGDGQPSVFYKDGLFHLTYCHVIYETGDRENGIYVATSSDGINFGDVSTHRRISAGNGLGITYNAKTKKYMKSTNKSVIESDTLDFLGDVHEYSYTTYDELTVVRNFPEFVRNGQGIVDTETFYVISLQGEKSTTDDWRANHKTWNGYVYAVNPCEYQNRTITLPNGGAATKDNLKGYQERKNSYVRPEADAVYAEDSAIKIDCVKEEAYDGATEIEISRLCYDYGSNLTDTWGKAYVAWNETYLYVFAHIYDATPDTSYGLLDRTMTYMHDSLDIFVDAIHDYGTGTEVPYGIEQYMIGVDANNTDFCIKGDDDYDLTDEFTGTRHRVKKVSAGYDLEVRVGWHDLVVDEIAAYRTIGIDFQINDAMGHGVGREASVLWSDHTGNSFRFVDVMGDLYLAK
ncbi:MAG: sugar-binding protein [Candidatus Enteromonas sp.]|nr:sugar-binding protein [Candidatus Enteromonas sp.]